MANCQKLCWSEMGSWQLKEFPLSKLPKGKKGDIPWEISALAYLKTVLDLILSNQGLIISFKKTFLSHCIFYWKKTFETIKFRKKKNSSSLANAKCSPPFVVCGPSSDPCSPFTTTVGNILSQLSGRLAKLFYL